MAVITSRLGNQAIDIMSNREKMNQLPPIGPGTTLHFIGVGGIGMSGLAAVCLEAGCRITGTDGQENDRTQDLRQLGADIRIGEVPQLVEGADLVIYSSAVSPNHPERGAADRFAIPTIRRGTLLAQVCQGRKLLGVAGTHGKTTTSSMLALAMRSAGFDPTIILGGYLPELGGNAVLGKDDYLVAETDESDGSFLELDPFLGIVTNVEDDHLEHYGNIGTLRNAFAEFLAAIPEGSRRIVCGDCPDLHDLVRREFGSDYTTYGFSEWCEVRGVDMRFDQEGSSCRVLRGEDPLGEIRVRVPGRHLLSNALAVYAAAATLDLPLEKVAYGLSEYRGAKRRFEFLGNWRGAGLIDDYAHHPTEIRATIQALRQRTEGRCIAVFQPHRYSRTAQLFDRFANTFAGVDMLILTEIYSAGEEPRPGVSSKHLMDKVTGVDQRVYAPTLEDVRKVLELNARAGDTILFLGAGNVNRVAFQLIEEEKRG